MEHSEGLPLTDDEAKVIEQSLNKLRMAITPYYASLIDPANPEAPIRKQAVPTLKETHIAATDLEDPLHEDIDSPAPGLTHRYPDRGILMLTDQCSMYCRHCTRRRKAGETDKAYTKEYLKPAIEYLRKTPTFRDILFTGGDPFLVSDELIDWVLGEVRRIPHIEIVRFGSRTPVVMPQRITDDLCSILKKYHPLWVNTHFNHPHEITPESRKACEKLADAGVPLGNQSVLLKGVNDCPYTFRELNQKLLTLRVRPYYIYQCDLSHGDRAFPHLRGEGYRDHGIPSGTHLRLAVPYFIVDAPVAAARSPFFPTTSSPCRTNGGPAQLRGCDLHLHGTGGQDQPLSRGVRCLLRAAEEIFPGRAHPASGGGEDLHRTVPPGPEGPAAHRGCDGKH